MCQFAFSALTISTPGSATLEGPGRVPVEATLQLAAGFAGANAPQSLQFDVPMVDTGTLTLQGGAYRGELLLGSSTPSGTYRLTVSYGAGTSTLSDNRLLTVRSVPLLASALFSPAAPKRDDLVTALVIGNRPLLFGNVSIGSLVGTPVAEQTCTNAGLTCPDAGLCQCATLDLSAVSVNGLSTNANVTVTATDLFGASRLDAGATLPVTRLRWVLPGNNTQQFLLAGTPPALDSRGRLYVTHFTPTAVSLKAVDPDGGVVGLLSTGGYVAHAAIGRFHGREVVFATWGGGGPAGIQAYDALTLADAGAVGFRTTSAGEPSAPIVVPLDAGSTALTTTFGPHFDSVTTPSSLVHFTAETLSRRINGAFAVSSGGSTRLMPNLVASGLEAVIPSILGSPTLVTTSALGNGAIMQPNPLMTADTLGVAITSAVGASPSVVASGGVLWGSPFTTEWTRNLAATSPGMAAVTATGGLIVGLNNTLVSMPNGFTGTATNIRSLTSPVLMTPVLGRPRGQSTARLGYAVTDAGEVVVFDGTSYLYSLQLSALGLGKPLPPTLDCNRQRPSSETGVLYIAFDSGAVVALVVDSPGLDPLARWPKYQRTTGNTGNMAFPVSEGCP